MLGNNLMPLKKLCRKVGCSHYAEDGHLYCSTHISLEELRRRPDYSKFKGSDLYFNKQWRDASKAFLLKHPVCVRCGDKATVTDHIIPHRNDLNLFWDESNWQPLCKRCHDKKTLEEINKRRTNSIKSF